MEIVYKHLGIAVRTSSLPSLEKTETSQGLLLWKEADGLPEREVWEVLITQTWTWVDIKFQLEHSAPPLSAGEPLQLQRCSSTASFNSFMMYQENHLSQLEFQSPSGTLKSFWLIRVSSNLCTRTQHTNRFQEKIMSQLQPHPHTINHINYFIQSGSNSQTEVSGTLKDAYLNSQRQGEETVFNNVDLYQCCFFLVLQFKNLWCSHCVQWRGFLFLLFFCRFWNVCRSHRAWCPCFFQEHCPPYCL